MTFHNRTGRLAHMAKVRDASPAALERSAPTRNRALCAGVEPWVAAMTGTKAAPPQPHRWWPVHGKGELCLRCSAYVRRAA